MCGDACFSAVDTRLLSTCRGFQKVFHCCRVLSALALAKALIQQVAIAQVVGAGRRF